jgi:Ca2+-binding RTX toxin-like protein
MPAAGHRSATVRIVTRRPATLSFTDFLCSGDRMAALDHGRVIADASPLVIAPTCDVYDPQAEAAFFDNRFTAGLVLLPAGTHELSFLTLSSFTGGFAGAFRIDKCTEVATGTPLLGTPGDDVLCGGPEGDVVAGDGGRDLILGGPGPDRLVAGAGAAALAGGSGGDVLVGAAGRMRMVGGRGGDVLVGGPGPDSLNGQAGDDRVFGRAGNDAISGGHGDDVLSGGLGRDICIGGPGTDLDLSCER